MEDIAKGLDEQSRRYFMEYAAKTALGVTLLPPALGTVPLIFEIVRACGPGGFAIAKRQNAARRAVLHEGFHHLLEYEWDALRI